MSDDNLDQPTEDGTSVPAPSTPPSADLEAIVARALESVLPTALDSRIKGFQSSSDKEIKKLAKMVEELKTAGLTPEEREQFDSQASSQELEELKTKLMVLEARKDHPEAVDFFMEAMGQGSFEDQIAFIESKLGKAVAQVVEEAVEESADNQPVPGVDPNNPSRKSAMGPAAALASGEMDEATADAILAAAPKGALAMFRRRSTA